MREFRRLTPDQPAPADLLDSLIEVGNEAVMGDRVGENGRPLTRDEVLAIRSLHRLARKWPDSLTLFSWSGSLHVFKSDEWDSRDERTTVASDYTVDTIEGIPNDGGDP